MAALGKRPKLKGRKVKTEPKQSEDRAQALTLPPPTHQLGPAGTS